MLIDPETRKAEDIISKIFDLMVALRRPAHTIAVLFVIVKITTDYPHQFSILVSVLIATLIFMSTRIVLIIVKQYHTIFIFPKQQRRFYELSSLQFAGKEGENKVKAAVY